MMNRRRVDMNVINYYIDKFRDELHRDENSRRRKLNMNTQIIDDNALILRDNHGGEVLYVNERAAAGFSPLIGHYLNETAIADDYVANYLENKTGIISLSLEQIENLYTK